MQLLPDATITATPVIHCLWVGGGVRLSPVPEREGLALKVVRERQDERPGDVKVDDVDEGARAGEAEVPDGLRGEGEGMMDN